MSTVPPNESWAPGPAPGPGPEPGRAREATREPPPSSARGAPAKRNAKERFPPERLAPDAEAKTPAPPAETLAGMSPPHGLGPLRSLDSAPEPRLRAGPTPASRAPAASLEAEGVELFRLGRDRAGRAELHLRLRCPEGLLEARLLEDGAQGVRVALGGSLADAQLDRLARALSRQGYETDLAPAGCPAGGAGDYGEQRRGPPGSSEEADALEPPCRAPGPCRIGAKDPLTPWRPSAPPPARRAPGRSYLS